MPPKPPTTRRFAAILIFKNVHLKKELSPKWLSSEKNAYRIFFKYFNSLWFSSSVQPIMAEECRILS